MDESAKESHLIDFTLEDQFRHVHRHADVEGRVVLLIGTDGKRGGAYTRIWGDAIDAAMADHPHFKDYAKLGYADLKSIPGFLKRITRRQFPKEPKEWAMMDWRGTIAKAYELASGEAHIVVFGPDGTLVHHTSGRELDQTKLEMLLTALHKLLDVNPPAK